MSFAEVLAFCKAKKRIRRMILRSKTWVHSQGVNFIPWREES
jgi:hypothetical protein